jgi:hypothetical protein
MSLDEIRKFLCVAAVFVRWFFCFVNWGEVMFGFA